MEVILASRNRGKLAELRDLFQPLGLVLHSQADTDIESPPETGQTFIENALIKARAAADASGWAALADDSGLVVPSLQGAPGIYSARYAGEHASDAQNNEKLMQALVGSNHRDAYFYCALVFLRHADDPAPLISTAAWHGEILEQPQGADGFGYDPLFKPHGFECSSAELPQLDKNQLSHRGQASRALTEALRANLRVD